jgi:hypothetical protein
VLNRQFSAASWTGAIVADLPDATNRKLVQAWNTPAELNFDIDGHSASAALINELSTEIVAVRWDELNGVDVPMFRGVIDHSQDTIDGASHIVSVTAHDYLAMLGRRIIGQTSTQITGSDGLVDVLLSWGSSASVSVGNVALTPGSNLPVVRFNANPDGTQRAYSTTNYTRTWNASTNVLTAISDLALSTGFDFDVQPLAGAASADRLRTFQPQQGIGRPNKTLEYGSTVAAVQRQVDSADYANYSYVQGQGTWADTFNTDARGTVVGLWQSTFNAADVAAQGTCAQQAGGQLNLHGLLVPTYTLTLMPGVWYISQGGTYNTYSAFLNMGDVAPLRIMSGRLAVNTTVRVVGITYDMGDHGAEDVSLVVGRPRSELVSMLTAWQSSVNALARR